MLRRPDGTINPAAVAYLRSRGYGLVEEPTAAAGAAAAPLPVTWWSQHGSTIVVGVITAVVSSIATYYALRAVK